MRKIIIGCLVCSQGDLVIFEFKSDNLLLVDFRCEHTDYEILHILVFFVLLEGTQDVESADKYLGWNQIASEVNIHFLKRNFLGVQNKLFIVAFLQLQDFAGVGVDYHQLLGETPSHNSCQHYIPQFCFFIKVGGDDFGEVEVGDDISVHDHEI